MPEQVREAESKELLVEEKESIILAEKDEEQLKDDASNSGVFFGKSGSIAYCTVALILYLTLV